MIKSKNTVLKFIALFILTMLFIWFLPTSYIFSQGTEPQPIINAHITYNVLDLKGFTPDTDITIIIDGGDPVTVIADKDGFCWVFGSELGFSINPGTNITATDNTSGIVKELEVVDLTVDLFNPETDTVEGTGPVGAEVSVSANNQDYYYEINVTVQSDGTWQAIFSDDLLKDMEVSTRVFDEDSDETTVIWQWPIISAVIEYDFFNLNRFSPNTDITIVIDGGDPFTLITDSSGSCRINGYDFGFFINPGMNITATDNTSGVVKELEVANLTVDLFDPGTDTIEGTGPVGAELWVSASTHNQDYYYAINVTVQSNGTWQAIFSDDLLEDMDIVARFLDEDDDETQSCFNPPTIHANLTDEKIDLTGFEPEADITIVIDDGDPFTIITDGSGSCEAGEWNFGFTVQPGMNITATDNTSGVVKELEVANLTVDVFDPENDTVEGTGPVGAEVDVCVWTDYYYGFHMDVTVQSDGTWQAVFSDDLLEDMDPQSLIIDEDGDETVVELSPPPILVAFLTDDSIFLRDFTWNKNVTVVIDDGDPFTVITDGDGRRLVAGSEFGFFIDSGMNIIVTDNTSGVVKELEVADLTVDVFDPETDTVEGTGPVGEEVNVSVHNQDYNYTMNVAVQSDGTWQAIFSDDLLEEMEVLAWILDDDGDATVAGPKEEVQKYPATIMYNGDTVVNVINTVNLSVQVIEEPNGGPGDITLAGDVTFEIFIGEDLINTFYAPTVEQSPGIGQAQISISLPVEVYRVVASIDSDYYTADPSEDTIIAIYDTEGSFVTGGGWFVPEGESENVNFGFEVKYKNDGTLKGNLEMIDHNTGTNYKAIDFTYMVVVDKKAYLNGNLMIDGEGSYTFEATVEDNGSSGKDSDRFNIDISVDGEHVVFDELIDKGNIVIHE